MGQKPSIPKGTRDFHPEEVLKRSFIFNTIEEVFKRYGYAPIQTPSMENLNTLTGKYGEEGDRLLFKVLNNGDFLAKADDGLLNAKESNKVLHQISKRGLRYDLTVPFARYVVMNQHRINFPFKRYQIQPVWRADRPQKGRYQEFYQCDADVVGSDSLMYEAELMQIFDEVFSNLGVDVTILINNRKILAGIAELCDASDKLVGITVAVDKIHKIGKEKVRIEIANLGVAEDKINKLFEVLDCKNLDELSKHMQDIAIGLEGIEELRKFHTYADQIPKKNALKFDVSLARGLGYYTGCIFEVMSNDVAIGSIAGGGRYDNLTGVFGLPNVSGVGISFGAARIFDVMEELDNYPEGIGAVLDVLLLATDEESHLKSFEFLQALRNAGIKADLYPTPSKIQKQMKYANKLNVPRVVIIGSQELESGQLSLKNMQTGDQQKLSIDEIIKTILPS